MTTELLKTALIWTVLMLLPCGPSWHA